MAETVFQPHSEGSCFIRQLNISQDFGTETLEDHECLIFSDRTRQLETHGSWKEDGHHVTWASLIDSPPGAGDGSHPPEQRTWPKTSTWTQTSSGPKCVWRVTQAFPEAMLGRWGERATRSKGTGMA